MSVVNPDLLGSGIHFPTSELQPIKEHLLQSEICDDSGSPVCRISYGIDGRIHIIETIPFENIGQTAEKHTERICVTDSRGNLIPEDITRSEARARGLRYLVVTTLLFHQQDLLVQQRSLQKKIDPGLLSASAHGVAKALFFKDGSRMTNIEYLALLNLALEINEELRHGTSTPPFRIVVWYGSQTELRRAAQTSQIDDPNTIYLSLGSIYEADSYPLGTQQAPRTRALAMGFVFSSQRPNIVIDTAELSSTRWERASSLVGAENVTQDLQTCIDANFDTFIEVARSDGTLGQHLLRRALSVL